MKKTVLIAKITLWSSYLVFMIVLVVREVMPSIESQLELIWLMWCGVFMFLAFYLLAMSTFPKPTIKPGRLYMLKVYAPHDLIHGKDNCTIVLSYDKTFEVYECDSIITEKEYTIKKIGRDFIFYPA